MPRQYPFEFRLRASRLVDTMLEDSDISESMAVKSVASKLGVAEESGVGGGARPKSMPERGLEHRVPSMPRSAGSSERTLNYAELMRF